MPLNPTPRCFVMLCSLKVDSFKAPKVQVRLTFTFTDQRYTPCTDRPEPALVCSSPTELFGLEELSYNLLTSTTTAHTIQYIHTIHWLPHCTKKHNNTIRRLAAE